ncbi:TonB-dependent receptor [Gimibacter soli]|uniref:TonB-dependent receptor n=1 Tax=Gimibacter soli TaxID=3024400 RepID=A0AAE9XQT8_9PROT|nr:TonB-dependent receptor [Gimibacter soli]WCL53406.1 TonB-dependent receptor [Gimibacter soli]
MNTKYTIRALLCSCASLAIQAPAAMAQDDSATSSVMFEEITVTAQKREQRAQDVGIAITAISGNQMKAFGMTNAQQITDFAPGVSTVQPNGEANYSIAIRGVANSDFTTNVESPVAIYVDETYISQTSGAGFMMFDLDRAEILRGPQGTLFGRNATGGLVHFITRKPSQEAEGYMEVSYGRFDRVRAEGAYGTPLNDQWSARVSFATNQGDGYITNRQNPGQKLNNANETAGRLQLLYEGDGVDLLLNARFGEQDIRTGFFEYKSAIYPTGDFTPGLPNPFLGDYVDTDDDVYAGDYDFTGHNDLSTRGYTATLNWEATDSITLTSITDYQTVKRDYIEDSDASPAKYFQFFLTTDAKQFSQELRLSGTNEELKWVTGLYYLDLDISDSNGGIMPGLFEALYGASVEELGFNGLVNPYSSKSKSWSLFGQLEYDLSDTLTLIGGARYISEKKDFAYRDIVALFPDNSTSGQDPRAEWLVDAVAPYEDSRKDHEWSARLQMDYKPSDDLLFYASWNRGVKSGGYNGPLLPTDIYVTDAFMKYEPEILNAFETGFKWDIAPGTYRLNGSVYYYDYANYQAFSIIALDTFTLNSQAKNKGFELEFQAAPARGLDIQLGVGYIDAKVSDVPGLTIDVDTPAGLVTALLPGAKVRPVQTPKWNLNGLVRYETAIGNAGNLALQLDGQYRSSHTFALTGAPAVSENGYAILNTSATWYPEDKNWSLRFQVQNLTDAEYVVQAFDLSGTVAEGGFFGLVEQYYGRPRQWSVTFSLDF